MLKIDLYFVKMFAGYCLAVLIDSVLITLVTWWNVADWVREEVFFGGSWLQESAGASCACWAGNCSPQRGGLCAAFLWFLNVFFDLVGSLSMPQWYIVKELKRMCSACEKIVYLSVSGWIFIFFTSSFPVVSKFDGKFLRLVSVELTEVRCVFFVSLPLGKLSYWIIGIQVSFQLFAHF